MSIFQHLPYKYFTPRVARSLGKQTISRSGILPFNIRKMFFCTYKNPTVKFRLFVISLLSIFKRGASLVEIANAGVIHSGWTAGYYHWLTESLPRALVLKDAYPEAIPILPSERYRNYTDSLRGIGFNEITFFPEERNAVLESPILTECPKSFGTTSPDLLKRVRHTVFTNCSPEAGEARKGIVYVSRRKARGRYVSNEDKVIDLLKPLGAQIICFEDLNFDGQVRLMRRTKLLISIHGAALTNMLFMEEGGSVIELLPEKNGFFDYSVARNSFKHDPCYIRLAAALGHEYRYLECRTDAKFYEKTHMANIAVDLASLRHLINQLV